MSLPTTAYFYYKGEIVHNPFCNAGWWYDGDVVALIEKMVRYDEEYKYILTEEQMESVKQKKQFPFLPLCDWDEIEVYGTKTPRSELGGI
jgi:hypothetical protein